jgi:hypothetical protein
MVVPATLTSTCGTAAPGTLDMVTVPPTTPESAIGDVSGGLLPEQAAEPMIVNPRSSVPARRIPSCYARAAS